MSFTSAPDGSTFRICRGILQSEPGLGHTFHGSISPMLAENSSIGNCPSCRTEVPASQILIEYMKEGEQAAYALAGMNADSSPRILLAAL